VIFVGLIYLVFITSFLTQLIISNYGFIYNVNFGICTTDDMNFFNKFINYKYLLNKTFYKDIENEKLYEGALKGMVEAVEDPYTTYLDKEDAKDLYETLEHEYDGIGVYLQQDKINDTIKVISVIENTPAQRAGILANDNLIKVNGVEYKANQINDAVSAIKNLQVQQFYLQYKKMKK